MSIAQVIRAMEAAGLFVEAGAVVHGIGPNGHVYARKAGRAWKLRRDPRSKVGRIVSTEQEAIAACMEVAR